MARYVSGQPLLLHSGTDGTKTISTSDNLILICKYVLICSGGHIGHDVEIRQEEKDLFLKIERLYEKFRFFWL